MKHSNFLSDHILFSIARSLSSDKCRRAVGEWERKESEREEIGIEMELKAPHISYLKSEQIERDLIDFEAEMHDMGEYYY